MKEQNHVVILTDKMEANSVRKEILELLCKKLLIEIVNYYDAMRGQKEQQKSYYKTERSQQD